MQSTCPRLLATVLVATLVTACQLAPPRGAASQPPPDQPPPTQRALAQATPTAAMTTPGNATGHEPQVLLLGEVHDNGVAHRLRTETLRARVDAGWRPVIVMEQFDREQQPALDGALRECRDAACVVATAAPGTSGWTWAFYEPVIELALRHDLPLRAGNLSRASAGKVIRDGLAAGLDAEVRARYGLELDVPADILAAQSAEVRDAHCGKLPEAMVAPMARAQVSRDVLMAEAMRPHASRGVVLVAGNGHVRRDFGVPYWLRTQGLPAWSVGHVEHPGVQGEYDDERVVAAIDRPDPCAQFKLPAPRIKP